MTSYIILAIFLTLILYVSIETGKFIYQQIRYNATAWLLGLFYTLIGISIPFGLVWYVHNM